MRKKFKKVLFAGTTADSFGISDWRRSCERGKANVWLGEEEAAWRGRRSRHRGRVAVMVGQELGKPY